MYQEAGSAQRRLTSLVEQFTRELMQSPPDLLVIGGLRQLLGAEASPGSPDVFSGLRHPGTCPKNPLGFLFRKPTEKPHPKRNPILVSCSNANEIFYYGL